MGLTDKTTTAGEFKISELAKSDLAGRGRIASVRTNAQSSLTSRSSGAPQSRARPSTKAYWPGEEDVSDGGEMFLAAVASL